jgi:hypothetical protein
MLLHFIITLGFLVCLLLSEVHAAPISLLERDGLSVLSGDQVSFTLLSLFNDFH